MLPDGPHSILYHLVDIHPDKRLSSSRAAEASSLLQWLDRRKITFRKVSALRLEIQPLAVCLLTVISWILAFMMRGETLPSDMHISCCGYAIHACGGENSFTIIGTDYVTIAI